MNIRSSNKAAGYLNSSPGERVSKIDPEDRDNVAHETPVDKFTPLSHLTDKQSDYILTASVLAGAVLAGCLTEGDPTASLLTNVAKGAAGGVIADSATNLLEVAGAIPDKYATMPTNGWMMGSLVGAVAGMVGANPFATGATAVSINRSFSVGIDALRGKDRHEDVGCVYDNGRLVTFKRGS